MATEIVDEGLRWNSPRMQELLLRALERNHYITHDDVNEKIESLKKSAVSEQMTTGNN